MSQYEGRDLTCIRSERRVFEGLSFTLAKGGALLLIGANGSGKSSLLRIMAGFLKPAQGQLFWDGQAVKADPESYQNRLHYVGHQDSVKPVLTVAENLAFWAGLNGGNRDTIADSLEHFGLTPLADVPGRLLSAGQKRRLALARLLAAPAALWLLDEPTVGLDTASQKRLAAAIAAQRSRGGQAVITTHVSIDVPQAETLTLDDFVPANRDASPFAETIV